MKAIQALVADDFAALNQQIIDQLSSRVVLVEDISHYITEAGGKRMRPLLVLLAAKLCQYQGQQAVPLAVIIEFIHTATLLHDDVVDLSLLRRGKPTANAAWGNAPSVLVGDFLYSRAFQMLVKLGNMPIMQLLSDTTNEIAEGEVFQLAKAGDPKTSRAEYFQIIRDKTAILFAGALKAAAILANASEQQQQAIFDYGIHLGIAFQLADDILDYQGDSHTMGKNIGDDLAEGKATLPLIFSIEHNHNGSADVIIDAIQHKSSAKLNEIIALVKSNGAIEHCTALAQAEVEKAKAALAVFPASDYRQGLEQLAEFALHRLA